jgi:DNA primase
MTQRLRPPPYQPNRNAYSNGNASGRRARPDGKTWQQDAQGKWRLVGGTNDSSGASLGPRTQPASRADHAIRLVLSNMALWDSLSAEDHGMLCDLPGHHGQLMRWLESQFHDHGPLAWGTLQEEIKSQDFSSFAQKLMAEHVPSEPGTNPRL